MRLQVLAAFTCLLLGLLWSSASHAQVASMYGGPIHVVRAIPIGPPVFVGPPIVTYGPTNPGNTTVQLFYPPNLRGSSPAFQSLSPSIVGSNAIAFRPIYQTPNMNFQQNAPSYTPYGGGYGPNMYGGFQPRANTQTFDTALEGRLNQIHSDLQAIKFRIGI